MEHELNRILLFLKNLDEGNREEAILRLSETHRLMSVDILEGNLLRGEKKRKSESEKMPVLSLRNYHRKRDSV